MRAFGTKLTVTMILDKSKSIYYRHPFTLKLLERKQCECPSPFKEINLAGNVGLLTKLGRKNQFRDQHILRKDFSGFYLSLSPYVLQLTLKHEPKRY